MNSYVSKEPLNKAEIREIMPGVKLYREYEKVSDDTNIIGMYIWKVELSIMSIVDFEVHIEKTDNIELDPTNLTETEIQNTFKTSNCLLPFKTMEVARVLLKDKWVPKAKFKLTTNTPDKPFQYTYISQDDELLQKNIRDNRQALSLIPFEHLTKEQCESELEKLKIKFIDLDFLPNDNAIIDSQFINDYLNYVIHWRRPCDFIMIEDNKEVRVFDSFKDPEPSDIHQGLLPDTQFVCALSALSEKYKLLERLFRSEKYSKYGIYLIKLCINGEWITVVIDDLFPCIPLSLPMVSNSRTNELWILILEKALAKVLQSYYNLTITSLIDFLQIMTGCPTLSFPIEDNPSDETKEMLLKTLKSYVVEKKYMTLAVSKTSENEEFMDGEQNDNERDIKPNHGYTMIDVKSKDKESVIMLRKVLFYEENVNKPEDDNNNTYILSYEDFLKEFISFAVCYAKNWDEVRFRGKFLMLKEKESGLDIALSKWYYCIQLDQPTNLIISLFQDEDRIKDVDSRKQLMDISITILKQDSTKNEITHIKTLDFAHSSNIQTELNLPTGSYIILPRTTGCFFGRPYDKQEPSITPLYDYEEKKFNPVFIATIKDIFKKFDLLLNRKIGFNEFKGFWECIKRETINEKFFKDNILSRYQCHEEGITEQGFITLFKETFFTEEGEKTIREWLNNLGYDTDLYALRSRCFMITFHSDHPISAIVRDALNTDLNNKINKTILKSFGNEIMKKNDIIAVQYQSTSSGIITLGCVNKGIVSYRVIISFSNDDTLLFSSKCPKIEKIVHGGSYEFFMHFFSFTKENISFELNYYSIN